jgi:hypothetical protein
MHMVKPLRLLLVLCAASILSGPILAGQQGNAADDQVLQAEQQRFAALVSADVAALDRLLGSDLTYVHSSGGLQDKPTFIAAFSGGKPRYSAFTGSDLRVRVVGDVAVVNGMAEVTAIGGDGKAQPPFTIRYTDMHVNRAGRWQLVAFQATRPPNAR